MHASIIFLYIGYFILSQEIIISAVSKFIFNGIEHGPVMHVLNFLEGYFKENTNK